MHHSCSLGRMKNWGMWNFDFESMKKSLLLFLLPLLLVACHGAGELSPRSSFRTRLKIGVGEAEGVKSSLDDALMDKISSLCVFLYRDGTLCSESSVFYECRSSSSLQDLEVELPSADAVYDLYVLANMGDVRESVHQDCTGEAGIMDWTYRYRDYSVIKANGVPMAGSLRGWNRRQSPEVTMKRLASRIDVWFENNSDYDVEIKSMVLRQSVSTVCPFSEGFSARSSEDMFPFARYDDYLTTLDVRDAMNGEVVHLYCLENMQGDLLPSNTAPENKNPDNLSDKSDLVTYFEICARVKGQTQVWDDVKYRFCLGEDATGNFNIPRNNILSYRVDFNSTPTDTGWTIEPGEVEYMNDVKVQVETVNYYPGWDVLTFPEATPQAPVRITIPGSGVYVVDGARTNLENYPSTLEQECITLGKKLFVRRSSAYSATLTQPGKGSTSINVNSAKEKLQFFLTGRNERGDDVRVDHLQGGDSYTLYVDGYMKSRGKVVPWQDIAFPDEIANHVGRDMVTAFWNNSLGFDMYAGDDDMSVNSFSADEDEPGARMCVCFDAPEQDCDIDYDFYIDTYDIDSGSRSMAVFDPDNLPFEGNFPLMEVDNSCADLSNPAASSRASVSFADNAVIREVAPWKKMGSRRSVANGTMDVSVNHRNQTLDFRFNEYSCGPASLSCWFWDYDTAPTGIYKQSVNVYLDVTYVPKFGLMFNAGTYGAASFPAARVTYPTRASTQIQTTAWGYQFLPARRDSRFKTELGNSSQDELLAVIAQNAPRIATNPDHLNLSGASVAHFNAGSVLLNPYSISPYSLMPNDGTVFFCDLGVLVPEAWTVTYPSKLASSYYMYNFKPSSAMNMTKAASDAQTWLSMVALIEPGFQSGSSRVNALMHRKVTGSVYVNYRIRCDCYLQGLMSNWNEY